jgi:aminopeptidase N
MCRGVFRACNRCNSVRSVPSLTHTDAQRRAALLSVTSYDVRLDLNTGDETFVSSTTIRFTTADAGVSTFLDVKPRALRSAVLNGRPLDIDEAFCAADGRLALAGLEAQNELKVDAVMAYSRDGEGLHRHVDPADGRVYLYAMSFLDAAPRWFACFDQPDLKAPVTLGVSCPPEWTVAGNGAATQTEPGHWVLATTPPLATYFTTLIAGPYHSITDEHDAIPLALHARASLAPHLDRDAGELLTVTKDCFDEFHRLFGIRYPWGQYHQAFVPEFNAGAMENPGCVTFRDPLVFRSRATDADRSGRASTIAHEMAHMWFGDLVTMRWWDDLWLNESFAEYLGMRVCDAVTDHASWVEFGIQRKAWGYAADRRPSTHPVAGNGAVDAASALNDFDGISYAKGASVLRQLATHLGDEVFLDGARRHFDQHAFGNAEFGDLIGSWTSAGAVDLPVWADAWLRTSGLDTLSAVTVGNAGQIRRDAPAGAGTSRSHAITVAAYDDTGRELRRVPVAVTEDANPVPGPEPEPPPALVLPGAGDETWAKIALGPETWQAMPHLLGGIVDPLARTVIWNALRLAVADAEVDPALALEIPLAAIADEPNDAVITNVLRWTIDTLVGAYHPAETRDAAYERVCAAALRAVQAAPAGSGRQLAAVRALVTAWTDSARLREWLAGNALPDGLVVDADLRWALLHRLAVLGELEPDEIADGAAADNTTQGAVNAARCRASLPDPLAKVRAWETLMTDASCSNYELYALADGFWQPRQNVLTAPFVTRYFDEIADTAGLRSGWVVARLAQLAYPWTAVHPMTLEHTDALLARADLDEGVRRSVVDAGDDLRRALDARQKYATRD